MKDIIMNELKMILGKRVINSDKMWFDIDRDEIIKCLNPESRYDLYIISKRGYIRLIRNVKMLRVLANRFRFYKKYMVITEVIIENKVKENQMKENVEKLEIEE